MRNFTNRKFGFASISLPRGKILVICTIAVVLTLGWLYWRARRLNSVSSPPNQETSSSPATLASTTIGDQFSFIAYNGQGQLAKPVSFMITKAELTSEVLVQGKPATAKGDKAFLVLHIEISNPETQRLYLAPVDLLRLIDGQDKKYAPDIHSDVVEVQPISTKITRVGFVVLKDQKQFNVQVGELEGEKQNLEIKF